MGVWPPSGSGSRRCAERGAAGKAGGGFLGWFPLVSFWMASTVRSQERGSDGARMGDAGRPGPWDAVCGRREGRGVMGGWPAPKGGCEPLLCPWGGRGQVAPCSGCPRQRRAEGREEGPGVPAPSRPFGRTTPELPRSRGGKIPRGKRSHGPSLAPSREERFLSSRGVKVMTKGGAAQERAISSPADPTSRAGGAWRRQRPAQAPAACTDLLLPETAGQLPASPRGGDPSGKGGSSGGSPGSPRSRAFARPYSNSPCR